MSKPASGRESEVLDCAIVGGGPGGLTAATYLGRQRRRFRVFDAGESRAAWIPTSHNTPGFPEGLSGEAMLARFREQAERYGAQIVRAEVTALAKDADAFVLTTADGETRARRVILATGVADREPDLPDVFDAVKKGLIRICPICDGYESSGLDIGVIGNCEHAAAEALFIRTWSERVTVIVPRTLGKVSDTRRKDLADAGIAIIESPIEHVSVVDGHLSCLDVGGKTRRFDVVYAALGVDPRGELARMAGAKLDDDGRLPVDAHQQTSVEGLYAAGDIVRGLNQVTVACAEAAVAAIAVHNSLPRNFA